MEKGVAHPILKPHPPNFQNQYNFWKSSNDITMTFWYSYWFLTFKKIQKPSCPSLKGSVDNVLQNNCISTLNNKFLAWDMSVYIIDIKDRLIVPERLAVCSKGKSKDF